MVEKSLLFAIFNVIEFINESELPNPGRMLILNYYQEAAHDSKIEKAREAIIRYTQCESLPLLADIQKKTAAQLSKLDHLILKLEFEAKKLEHTAGA
jgi:hypothetical protein